MSRPNFIVAVFDSLSEVACQRLASKLPTITTIRDISISFANAYVCSPEGGPARASLFTGLDMAAHGVWTDGVTLPAREETFPERFRTNGYETWLIGRRHLAGVSNWTTEHARPHEYSHLEWGHGPLHRSRQNAYLTWLKEIAPTAYADIFPTQANPDETDIPPSQHKAIADLPDELSFNWWIGERMCAQISSQGRAKPFLGIAGFVVGQTMGGPPNVETCTEGLNKRSLRQADDALEKILRCLDSEKLSNNTSVTLTAGRGCQTEGDADQQLRETAIKVPLMIRTPTHKPQRIESTVSTMDVAPTLYDLAQISAQQRVQGATLLNDSYRNWAMSRLRHPSHRRQTSFRIDQWKLVMAETAKNAPPTFALFDLSADPDEQNDLAKHSDHQDTLENMIDQMIDARVALEDRTEPRIAMF